MAELLDGIKAWIAKRNFDISSLKIEDGGGAAYFTYDSPSESGEINTARLHLDVEKKLLALFLLNPIRVPEQRRRDVSELLTLANTTVDESSLYMLPADGQIVVLCRTFVDESSNSVELIDRMDAIVLDVLKKHVPAITATAFAGRSPQMAFADLTGESLAEALPAGCIDSADDVADWGNYPGAACLKRWAEDLKSALSAGEDFSTWDLVGNGALIFHDDEARARVIFRKVAVDAGMQFALVPSASLAQFRLDLVDPFRSLAPALVYLEPGEWMCSDAPGVGQADGTNRRAIFRSQLIQRMKSFDKQYPVVFATAVRSTADIDDSLRAVGAFERRFVLPSMPMDYRGNELLNEIGRELCGLSLSDAPGKVGKLITPEFDSVRTQGLLAQAMKRLANRENRKLEFIDLVNFVTRGTIESDDKPFHPESVRRQVAYHEAGHALVAVLDSEGRNIPEYASIVASLKFEGVVVKSVEYYYASNIQTTYLDFRHHIRLALAGRAGEQILVGPGKVSNGAISDLSGATEFSKCAFGSFGFAPGMDDPANAGANLAVIGGDASPSEVARLETLVRGFLESEYRTVMQMLLEHRPMLDAIADRLMWDAIVDQDELMTLCKISPEMSHS